MGELVSWRKLFRITLVLIAIISIGIFIANTDFIALKKQLHQVGFKFIYILLLTCSAYLLGTLGWQVCLGDKSIRPPLLKLFAIRQIGETLALYNPTSVVAGDLLKAQLLSPYHISQELALKSVTSSRITATLSQILLFIVAMIWLLSSKDDGQITQNLKSIISVAITVLLSIKIALLLALSKPIGQSPIRKESSIWQKTKSSFSITFYHCKIFFQREKKSFWYSYIYFTSHWIVGSMELYLLLLFMGYPIHLMDGLVLDMSIIVIKSIGASIPGQVGIEEFANKITLDMIGFKGATLWISISVLRRFRQLIWAVIGILLALSFKTFTCQSLPLPQSKQY